MSVSAVLYNKHIPLVQVKLDGMIVVSITEIYNPHMLPIILHTDSGEIDIGKMNSWLEKRQIPDNRDGIAAVRNKYVHFAEQRPSMFSLSDQYWMQYTTDQTWDSMNFFTNRYSQDTGCAFFTPWLLENTHRFGRSPDYTTNGALKKTWKLQPDGTSHLIKAGSRKLHQEPITEVLASAMLEKLNIIPFVKYTLTVEGMTLCSECANFVDKNTEFVPASHIYFSEPKKEGENVYTHLLRMCDKYEISGAKEYIDSMITADRILGNDDRHLGNFGFIRDAQTGRLLRFAPLFDSGSAYGGKTNRVNKQRLFEAQKEEAINNTLPKINLHELRKHHDVFELISIYPDINKRQREFIKRHIIRTEEELNRKILKTMERVDRQGDER